MKYEVRYQVDGEESSTVVEAESAAVAAQLAQEEQLGAEQAFELIQVHLLDDTSSVMIEDQAKSTV